MENPTPQDVLNKIATSFPPEWVGGFVSVYQENNRIWLRRPGRETIIRIEVTELPRDQWPSFKDA